MPLGPGFRHASRQANIRQGSAASFRIHVRVTDQLTNAGTRALAYLDVALPAGVSDTTSLSILVDGKKAQAVPLTPEPGAPVRIRFEPPWPQREPRSFVFDYDLAPNPGSSVAAAPDAFYLADPNALPHWLPPAGVFVTADSQARREEFDVAVPSAFQVVAAGRTQRQRKQGDLALHRFRLSGKDYFPPFFVAGRYQEARVTTEHGDVIFWTLHPLDAQAAKTAAERLADSAAIYEKTFGPAAKNYPPIRIAEIPAAAFSADEDQAAPFPYGALLSERAFAKGITDDSFLQLAECGLARTWFGWTVRAEPGSETLWGRGAGLFAVVMAADARAGEAARKQAISRLLAAYDQSQAVEKTAVKKGAPPSDAYKSALFWVALQDVAGKEPMQRAIRHILQALNGREANAAALRSALESEAGRDLTEVFRTWMERSGIPADFRARYPAAP